MSSYRVDSLSASSSRQICKYFASGRCIYGVNCRYLHTRESNNGSNDERGNDYSNVISGESSSSTLRLPNSNSNHRRSNSGSNSPTRHTFTNRVSPQICKYFLEDRCLFGNACWYTHEMPDNDSTRINTTDSQKSDLKNQKDKQKAKEVVEEEYTCSICYETPKLFGLLVHCDHIFCRDCIKEWRKTSNVSSPFQDTDTTKTCPVCRKNSPYFVPSCNFTKSGPQKEQIISDYKDRMSRIPCKHFAKSRKCPFADACFYRHANPDGSRCILGPPRKRKSRFLSGIRYIGGEFDISLAEIIDGFDGFHINLADWNEDVGGWEEPWTDEADDDDDVENSHYISEHTHHVTTMEVVANEDDDDNNQQWDSSRWDGW